MKAAKWLFDTLIYYPIFTITLTSMSVVARLKFLRTLKIYSHLNAKVVLLARFGRRQDSIEAIGEEWKRMFPNDMQRLVKKDDETVYYETHTWCALRGTGDADACYRMMEFDREMHRSLGGEFVVIRSQAERGRKTCIVAMRKAGSSTKDLEHAHVRVAREEGRRIPMLEIED